MEDLKLSEEDIINILNPENLLLKEFQEKAPKTYQHCEAVSRLCEKIGRELKLNVDILKIVGLYHDIGKMRNPQYFCENQSKTENIHDKLDSFISYKLITTHVADSIAIIITKMSKIPLPLIKCISMHHGNTILKSIYSKIQKETINPDLFRYPFSKPNDVYSGILMICDNIESTMKAISTNGHVKEENEIADIIKTNIANLIADGQLDELTIGQHRAIIDILCAEFAAANQKRIIDGYTETKT